jgi:hypothetical protein
MEAAGVKHNADPLVKIPVVSVLVFNGDKAVTEAIVRALRDDNADVRIAAIT